MCNQVLIHLPNILKALAKTASFAILSFVLLGRWGTAALRRGTVALKHYRSSGEALPWLNWSLGVGVFIPSLLSHNGNLFFSSTISFPGATKAALSLPHSPLEPLKLLPLISFQIQESLSLQTALESSPNYSSSSRALGSSSSWWIVFVTLIACS
jgi:hypothetical protein